ncbi:MAG: 50S ribosomal protein L32 [Deltaproteobacteria bacterium]|nr:MAG: 50S ribosomal protein L32 [Deltaproteobacteria bacterium]
MAVPKKKKSKAKRDSRRGGHLKFRAPNVIDCPQCAEPMLPHRACPKCGFYKGRQVIEVKQSG